MNSLAVAPRRRCRSHSQGFSPPGADPAPRPQPGPTRRAARPSSISPRPTRRSSIRSAAGTMTTSWPDQHDADVALRRPKCRLSPAPRAAFPLSRRAVSPPAAAGERRVCPGFHSPAGRQLPEHPGHFRNHLPDTPRYLKAAGFNPEPNSATPSVDDTVPDLSATRARRAGPPSVERTVPGSANGPRRQPIRGSNRPSCPHRW
jgi:hypothetical protein